MCIRDSSDIVLNVAWKKSNKKIYQKNKKIVDFQKKIWYITYAHEKVQMIFEN